MADTTITRLPTELTLTPLSAGGLGQARPIMDWLTTFHLASVVLDPYTNESSWILKTAKRILEEFRGSHARVNFIVTANEDDVRAFMGPLLDEFLVGVDEDTRGSVLDNLSLNREITVAVAGPRETRLD